MPIEWKLITTGEGTLSLENPGLGMRSFHRLKVYLKNRYCDKYREKEEKEKTTKSFLYQLVMGIKEKESENTCGNKPQFIEEIFIDQNKIIVSWDEANGLCITAEEEDGNQIVMDVAENLEKETTWWRNC